VRHLHATCIYFDSAAGLLAGLGEQAPAIGARRREQNGVALVIGE
jgi:hypothetical protein